MSFDRETSLQSRPALKQLILEPPLWLDKIAKEHWLYFAPLLADQRLLTATDISLLAAASERWSVYRRAAVLMKGSVRGKKYAASERMRLAEQAARKKLVEQDVNLSDFLGIPLERKRGKLRRGQSPEGNEISAEPVFEIDAKLLGEYTVPPQHSVASQSLQDYVTLMRELGVGPVTRVRMKTPPEREDDGNDDSDKITELRSRRIQRAANLD